MEQYFNHQTRLFDKWNKLPQLKAPRPEDEELKLLRAKRETKFDAKRREDAQIRSDYPANEISSETATQPIKLKAHQLLEPERPVQSTRSTRSRNPTTRRSPTPPISCVPRWTEQHPSWPDHWQGDSLVYPPQGDRRATVDKQDIVRLDEGEFLNDNLIWFYLRHLEERIKEKNPETAKRVYFMTPFFYQRLTAGKGRSPIDYDGVKRWTSKIDIFSYDYVIVPVNEHAHWYLAVICNASNLLKQTVPVEETVGTDEEQNSAWKIEGAEVEPRDASKQQGSKSPNIEQKVGNMSIGDGIVDLEVTDAPEINASVERTSIVGDEVFEDDTATTREVASAKPKKSRRTVHIKKHPTNAPRIITMDSLGYSHSPVCSNLRDFLVKEAKARKDVDITLPKTPLGLTAKNIPLQDNHCDCGLYLLIYVESILANPDATIHDILQASPDVGNHFNNLSASKMRSTLRKLIFRAKEEQMRREKEEKAARMRARKAAKGESSKSATADATAAAPSPSSLPKVLPRVAFENPTGQHAQNDNCSERDNSQIAVSPPAHREQRVKSSPHRVVHLPDQGTAERDDPLEMEADSPAAAHVPLESSQSKRRSSSDCGGFETLIDELAGAATHSVNELVSNSVEVGDRAASSEPTLTTAESIECVGEKPSSTPRDEPEFTARNALHAQRARESSPESDAEKSASDIHPSELSKRTPQASMSPVQPPLAFKRPIQGMSSRTGSVDLDEPASIHINSDPEPQEDEVAKSQRLKQALAMEPLRSGIATSSQPVSVSSDGGTMIPVTTSTPPQKKRSRPDHLRTKSPQHKMPRHIKFNEDGSDPSSSASSQDSLLHVMSPQTVRRSAEMPPTELEVVVTPGRPVRVDDEDKDVDLECLFPQLPKSPARSKTSPRQHVGPTTGLAKSKSPCQNHSHTPQRSSPRTLAPAGFYGSPGRAQSHKMDDKKQKKSIEIVDID